MLGFYFASFYDFSIEFWNCSDRVVFCGILFSFIEFTLFGNK